MPIGTGRCSWKTYSLLRQLSRPLILAVSQQFDHSSLVGCQASDFLDDLADESGAFAQMAFAPGHAGFDGEGCDFLDGVLVSRAVRS